ncbi:hypothetical protein, partial [Dermacoccus nishinomiyaensis]|uniref:hypothetical protein n=1 Tax=Dermacoccus nishinomiyaensis TaxID=1274 RepID=UPI0016436A5A
GDGVGFEGVGVEDGEVMRVWGGMMVLWCGKEKMVVEVAERELPEVADVGKRMKKGERKSVKVGYPVMREREPE